MKKLRFLFLALVPVLVLMLSACADDGDNANAVDDTVGYRIVDGVWEIYNKYGLISFRDNVTTDGNDNISAKLVSDINLEGSEDNQWVPIGNHSNQYAGTFDGDNYTISGLYINDSTAGYQGLFGVANVNATIKNLLVKDVEITANDGASAIVAVSSADIINVYVDNVTIVALNFVGAIVGYNQGNIYVSSASNIELTATVSNAQIGGISGYNDSNIVATYVNNAIITADASLVMLGGIVGHNYSGEIVSSYINDMILNNTGNSTNVGGIIGNAYRETLSSNYFVSGNSLNGVGNTASNDNATRLTSIQALNDNVTVMNGAIDTWVGNDVDREFGYRYEVLSSPDNATKIPTLISN